MKDLIVPIRKIPVLEVVQRHTMPPSAPEKHSYRLGAYSVHHLSLSVSSSGLCVVKLSCLLLSMPLSRCAKWC